MLRLISLDIVMNDVSTLIEFLAEADSRRLFAERGYSSLLDYVTKCLGYSEGSAYRRINAARLLK